MMLEADEEIWQIASRRCFRMTIGSPIAGVIHASDIILLFMLIGVKDIFALLFWKSGCTKKKSEHMFRKFKRIACLIACLLLVLIYLMIYMIGTADQYVVIDKMR